MASRLHSHASDNCRTNRPDPAAVLRPPNLDCADRRTHSGEGGPKGPRERPMYCEYYGLAMSPFNNTPDPRFFFNTPDHEEALASLVYAAQERKGFVLVTGEVGSGKTLLSRLL